MVFEVAAKTKQAPTEVSACEEIGRNPQLSGGDTAAHQQQRERAFTSLAGVPALSWSQMQHVRGTDMEVLRKAQKG